MPGRSEELGRETAGLEPGGSPQGQATPEPGASAQGGPRPPQKAEAPAAEALEAFCPVTPSLRPQFDEIDALFVQESMAILDQQEGPRLGDFVRFPDGALHRFSRDAGDRGFQTTDNRGSYFIYGGSNLQFAGSHALVPFVDKSHLILLDETREGAVWTFHHQNVEPFNRVDGKAPFRVYGLNPNGS